jgi:flavodoxin/Fe-S-cluster-containing hydrogenase component 2
MKSLIVCFSQTGNTLRVANRIRDGIRKETGHCELMKMDDVDPASLQSYDLVGLGCPVFYYQEPLNVRDFMKGLPLLPDKHWFVFCTHASIIGNTFPSMTGYLKQKGITVVGYHDTYADATLPFYPHPTLTSGHPDSDDLKDAYEFGRDVVNRSRHITSGKKGLLPQLAPVPEEWIENAERFTLEFMEQAFPSMRINPDRCTACMDCEGGCPVDGIGVTEDPPRIQDPCIYCWNCVKICPEAAIEADWSQQVKLAPQLYSRYRYWLDEAARRGEFRWLLDPESIDFTNPFYKQREQKTKQTKEEN